MVVIEPHYLPLLEFFCAVIDQEAILLDAHAHFQKQSLRTRTTILTAAGPLDLRVPVIHPAGLPIGRVPLCQVRIDYSSRWPMRHWRTIVSAYRKAPYFEHYAEDFHDLLLAEKESVFTLNMEILRLCLRFLNLKTPIRTTDSYQDRYEALDLRNVLNAKEDHSKRDFFRSSPYQQVFGGTFLPNLSVLDVIFCCGPDAGRIIDMSAVRNRRKSKEQGDHRGASS